MALVTEIYQLTNSFPKEEIYGLTSQIGEVPFLFQVIYQKVMEEMEIKII